MDGRNDQQESELERAAEKRRRLSAGLVAAAAIVVSSFVVVRLAFGATDRAAPVLQPVLALMMSLALVSGFRSLDGPIGGTTGRRGVRASSDAAAGLTLWLACFAAIWAALFLSGVSSEIAGRARTSGTDSTVRPGGGVATPAAADGAAGMPTRAAAVGQGAAGKDAR